MDRNTSMASAIPISIANELLEELSAFPTPTQALQVISSIRAELEILETEHVDRARAHGASWEAVANALGTTRQGAWKKHAAREI